MNQQNLLSWSPPVVAPSPSEQSREIARVSGRIAPVVLDFCRRVWARHEDYPCMAAFRHFHASDVVAFVDRQGVACAPASVDRILRELRRGGFVSYTVVDRSRSLYRLDHVRGA